MFEVESQTSSLPIYLIQSCVLLVVGVYLVDVLQVKSLDKFAILFQCGIFSIFYLLISAKWTGTFRFVEIVYYWPCLLFLLYIIAVLFGAPFYYMIERTLIWCLFLSLPIFPLFLDIWNHGLQIKYDQAILSRIVGVLLGSWLGAIPIPLDWDRPWQVWPVSCLFGSSIGLFLGTCFGAYLSHSQRKSHAL